MQTKYSGFDIVYNQYNTRLQINQPGYSGPDGKGSSQHTVTGYYEGSVITFTWDGGEVSKTQGTDGASINIATLQGCTIAFTVRESSASNAWLYGLVYFQRQSVQEGNMVYASSGATVNFWTGVYHKHVLANAFISNPSPLSTGDKQMGSMTYTLTSPSNVDFGQELGADKSTQQAKDADAAAAQG